MLRNRYYIGSVGWSENEYQGRHPKLVSQDLFDRVQVVLAKMPGAGSRTRRYNHYLKGLIWCQRCDRRLIVMRGKSKTGSLYFYYVCRGRQDGECDLPYLRVAQVEKAVAQHHHTIQLSPELQSQLRALFDKAAKHNLTQDEAERGKITERLAELERQEERYLDLALEPDWPKAKLTERLRAIRDERARLQTRLSEGPEQIQRAKTTALRVLDYLQQPAEIYANASVPRRAELNRLLFSKLKVDIQEPGGVLIKSDEPTDPFATVIYLRRTADPVPSLQAQPAGAEQANGAVSKRDDPVLRAMLTLLQPRQPSQSSSNSDLAEDARFELARGYPQHAFQACAIGQLGESSVSESTETRSGPDAGRDGPTTRYSGGRPLVRRPSR